MNTLILVTSSPNSVLAWHAFGVAESLLKKNQNVQVFFYQDGVAVANTLNWSPEDQRQLTQAWQALNIRLPVCVSAALTRGITDQTNATRHQLAHFNLASGFELVGLGEFADAVQNATRLIQF
ncbi:sulfurtransferase complex subunit TusD [Acinetobacter sp. MD2(2019)]|uniref:sulfurtransferase complex subunit TusD n=1 Tax=Acinetobacter sp. MD2(2019) TaxID=2605273 RepID=UPI002D1F0263|nr:sulfurtransferase complex subunit TusD [Acinetobacter sp. MD2(2019)]MEB3753849.1 sulfurtransferase complex subunit TusD [Acinetobacter sp. MD2(2019)]